MISFFLYFLKFSFPDKSILYLPDSSVDIFTKNEDTYIGINTRNTFQIINEKYSFDNHITLVGAGPYKISSSNQLENITMSQKEIKLIADKVNVSEADVLNWNWYKWNNSDLVSQNLDKNMLGDSEYFYVNYEHAEILYSNKTSKNNLDYYSMTGLKNINK